MRQLSLQRGQAESNNTSPRAITQSPRRRFGEEEEEEAQKSPDASVKKGAYSFTRFCVFSLFVFWVFVARTLGHCPPTVHYIKVYVVPRLLNPDGRVDFVSLWVWLRAPGHCLQTVRKAKY